MGLTHFKGNYCLKCQSPRGEAIGAMPRCEQCGDDLKYVEVGHPPVRFAGYFFLGVLILSVFGVVIMTLVMALAGIVALMLVAVASGILFIACIIVSNSMLKKKIADTVKVPKYGY